MNEDDILDAAEKLDAAPVPTEDRMIAGEAVEVLTQNLDDLIAGETEILDAPVKSVILKARRFGKTDKQKRINKLARNARKTNRGNR